MPLETKKMGERDLFYIKDGKVSLRNLTQTPLPPLPRDVSLTAHWLAVEGVQPAIPQNPPLDDVNEGAEDKLNPERLLSKEQQLLFEIIKKAMRNTEPGKRKFVEATLTTLRKDSTLPQLLPYCVKFVADEVKSNLTVIPILQNLMKMVEALCTNEDKNLHIEPYVY